MFIKQVTIHGFKSYKEATTVEPFSAGHNVVVGKNGAGKSNFFTAIRFVLSDMFSGEMRSVENRQALINDTLGAKTVTAYVEIVFENTGDHRLQIDKEEVTLRRVFGDKKDDYFLEGKHIKKEDVMNMLEAAGFSRSNPYYIVQQGKINSLTQAKDSERLKLLKEVAGTQVYDDRRAESLKLIEDTHVKREEIDEMLGYIEERLKELREEQEELTEYQQLDKERRRLEFNIHNLELNDTRRRLEDIDAKRSLEQANSSQLQKKSNELADGIREKERDINRREPQKQRLAHSLDELQTKRESVLAKVTQASLKVKDAEKAELSSKSRKEENEKQLVYLRKTIKQKEAELQKIKPEYEQLVQKEKELQSQLNQATQRHNQLGEKQGRLGSFKTVAQRDAHIKDDINRRNETMKSKKEHANKLANDIRNVKKTITLLTDDINSRKGLFETLQQKSKQAEVEIKTVKTDMENWQSKKREMMNQFSTADSSCITAKAYSEECSTHFKTLIGKDISSTLEAVERIVKDYKISGVHGPLIQLFECHSDYNIAVETAAKQHLFSIVVETDEVAQRILAHLPTQSGRITFIPLSKLKLKNHTFRTVQDTMPIIDCLKFDPKFKLAMNEVFGKVLLCKELTWVNNIAKKGNESIPRCVTLDGDERSKGMITGGYRDVKDSRISAMLSKRNAEAEFKHKSDEKQKLKLQVDQIDQTLLQIQQDFRLIQEQLNSHQRSTLLKEVEEKTKQLERKTTELGGLENRLAETEEKIQAEEMQIKTLQEELGSPLVSRLTEDERRELADLTEKMPRLQLQHTEISKKLSKIEEKTNELEQDINTNLKKQEISILSELQDLDQINYSNQLELLRIDLTSAQHEAADLSKEKEAKEIELADITRIDKEDRKRLEQLRAEEKKFDELIAKESKSMQVIETKKNILLQRKEELTAKIRDLGSLPSDTFTDQTGNKDSLIVKLQKCNEKLKKFSHVNKKACDQFVNFSEQRDQLVKKKAELDEGDMSIKELIQTLDQRKEETITRTFKQVASNFKQVFAELVPNGTALLVLVKKTQEELDRDAASASSSSKSVENYSGISVRVSFTGKSDETHVMQQLSGGQKSLVALALIFAIQRCDRAPFYLFDEIDQALDTAHRTAVAELIHREAANTQFITTTFGPELLTHADKFYAVTLRNKVSMIQCVSKANALDFIEEQK